MLSDMTPFKMIGNLYFVGTKAASSHLIDTGEGLILIDSGYAETADIIVESMGMLGFDIKDVRYLLHSHGHYDHTGGAKKLVELSGAESFLHPADFRYLSDNTPHTPLRDGFILSLGNTEITCLHTPGHTEGTMSFFFTVEEDGKKYRAGMFGGAGTNQLKRDFLMDHGLSFRQRAMFLDSIKLLREQSVDVFVGNHSWNNNTPQKYQKSLTQAENPFIDPTEWGKFLDKCEHDMLNIMDVESRTHFVNYGHRGACAYAPENTMSSFEMALSMGANGIETDVQLTADGVAVLFHDDTLTRVTGKEGRVSDYTYEQLQTFTVKNGDMTDRIPTLDEFLARMERENITLAIELKQRGTAEIVADCVRAHGLDKRVVITSFMLDELARMRQYAPSLQTGFLTRSTSMTTLQALDALKIDEYCPHASSVTKESVKAWHRLGFNVRAWGVKNEELMRNVYLSGADGMTVNFPDKMTAFIDGMKEVVDKNITRIRIPFEKIYTSAFVVTTDKGVALLDCGTTLVDVKGYIAPTLQKMGLIPDVIVASHCHADHVGGMPHLAALYPDAKLAMVSETYAARFSENRRQILRDGDVLLGCLRVMHFPAHSGDAIAILDERTRTLLTFDCLQAQGIDRFGTGLSDIAEYINSIERISEEEIENIVTSHEYAPVGSIARGKQEIGRYLAACREDIDLICDFVAAHPDLDIVEIFEHFKEAYPEHPTVPERTFKAARKYLSEK